MTALNIFFVYLFAYIHCFVIHLCTYVYCIYFACIFICSRSSYFYMNFSYCFSFSSYISSLSAVPFFLISLSVFLSGFPHISLFFFLNSGFACEVHVLARNHANTFIIFKIFFPLMLPMLLISTLIIYLFLFFSISFLFLLQIINYQFHNC